MGGTVILSLMKDDNLTHLSVLLFTKGILGIKVTATTALSSLEL